MSNKVNNVFGVDFYSGTKSALLVHIKELVKEPYSFIVTPNVDHLVQLDANAGFRDAYGKAGFRVCDSRILLPLLRSLGADVKEVITGSDLSIDVLRWADSEKLRLVIVGATPEECNILRRTYPGITVFHHNPPMGFIDRPVEVQECLQFIYENQSEIIFFAVGAPRQEILASLVSPDARKGLGFCVGASISFAAGTIKRAPVWMQELRLEWLHRMLVDPRRLVGRYIRCLTFIIPAYFREKRK